MKRQNPQTPPCFEDGMSEGFAANLCAESDYFSTASLNAFAARKRTTVLALILIASPVAGLRPMRALRCAFTERPRPGITNLPAPFVSFTASLKNSSKNDATCFLDTGFSGVLTFSAMCAIILDLISGFAIELIFPPRCILLFPSRCNFFFGPGGSGFLSYYIRTIRGTQGNPLKKPEKCPFLRAVYLA